MRVRNNCIIFITLLLLVGCEDNVASGPSPSRPLVDMDTTLSDSMPSMGDASVAVKPPPVIAGLKLEIRPWRTQITRQDTPTITVYVEQEDRDVDVTTQALFRVEPESLLEISIIFPSIPSKGQA